MQKLNRIFIKTQSKQKVDSILYKLRNKYVKVEEHKGEKQGN